ncbi:hypothetical protein [Streptomyces goshikiensis]|uniref:hypothetical protein n=1 Tax=Streptomyces goshikiensis TaxID=1942 RepID=UPI003646C8F4
MNLVQEGLALGIPAPGQDARQRPSAARIYRMWFGTEGALPADEDLARKILNAFRASLRPPRSTEPTTC